jgi:hypothetical protein
LQRRREQIVKLAPQWSKYYGDQSVHFLFVFFSPAFALKFSPSRYAALSENANEVHW